MHDLHDHLVDLPPGREGERVQAGSGSIRHDLVPRMVQRLIHLEEGDEMQLDLEVAHVLGHGVGVRSARFTQQLHGVIRWSGTHPYAGESEPCPRFTTSLDAVMTLAFATPGVDAMHLLKHCVSLTYQNAGRAAYVRLPRNILVSMFEALAAEHDALQES